MRIRIRLGEALAAEVTARGLSTAALQYAGEREKTRIIDRTLSGRDYLDRPFTPYSRNGPYYYYPIPAGGRNRAAAARRLAKRLDKGGQLTRTGRGIRFEDYNAFKGSLGRPRGLVDLMGARAPHMLQAIVVRVRGNTIVLGIYGDAAARATGHNEGIPGRLPQRRWFDVSLRDLKLIAMDIVSAS